MIEPEGAKHVIEPRVVPARDRKQTDVGCAIIFVLGVLVWLIIAITLMASENFSLVTDDDGNLDFDISDDLQADIDACEQVGFRKLDEQFDRRLGADKGLAVFGDQAFVGNQKGGIFDALGNALHIPITLLGGMLALAVLWIVLLREFARPIVYATEFMKVALLGYMGLLAKDDSTAMIIFFIMAAGYLCMILKIRKQLDFSSKIISHGALAIKKNPTMFYGLLGLKFCYVVQSFIFIKAFSASYSIWEVTPAPDCVLQHTNTGSQRFFLGLIYVFCVQWFTQARLSTIAQIVGSWHFHPESTVPITQALTTTCTTSLGAVSFSAVILTILMEIKKKLQVKWWKACCMHASTGGATIPLHIVMCCLLWCIERCMKMLTKFTLIIHCFTGQSFVGSAKLCYHVMKRHFVNGFITDAVSVSVLALGSFVGSLLVSMTAWAWIDAEYGFHTISASGEESLNFLFYVWIVFMFCNVYNPVMGVFFIILLDMILGSMDTEQHKWVAPMAATFIGAIARLFFNYIAGIMLDTIDVCFVCWAVDKDNNVDLSNSEFSGIVTTMPGVKKDEFPGAQQGVQMVAMGQPVQQGQFMPQQPQQGQVQMMQQPMMMVDANGQPVQVIQGQPVQMLGQQMVVAPAGQTAVM